MDKCTTEWTNEQLMTGNMRRQLTNNGEMNGEMNGQMNEKMNGKVNWQMMNKLMDECTTD